QGAEDRSKLTQVPHTVHTLPSHGAPLDRGDVTPPRQARPVGLGQLPTGIDIWLDVQRKPPVATRTILEPDTRDHYVVDAGGTVEMFTPAIILHRGCSMTGISHWNSSLRSHDCEAWF